MKLVIPCLLAAAFACAQSTAQLEIRGTVVEGTLGVGGVTVTLYEFGHTPPEATTRTVFATTFTDSQGAFVFHPVRTGEYYVEVQKDGYFTESFGGPTVDPADSTGDAVSISADHPLQGRKFSLWRLGEIRGRVVDGDGNPLANVRIGLRPPTFHQTSTDRDGYFVAPKLRPEDYQVGILPQHGPEIRWAFSEEDLKKTDKDLESSFWPSAPLPVRYGASLSVGTITVRKVSYYRAHLVVSGECTEGERWIFSTTLPGLGTSVPCGREFLVSNLAPGSYSFSLTMGGRPQIKRWAITPVEVTDRNIEVTMAMSAGAEIRGRFLTAEGAPLPSPGKIGIALRPLSGLPAENQKVAQDPAGAFLIRGVTDDRQQVIVMGLANKFYVKEIRYNGLMVADGVITPIAGSPGLLDIVIDDKPATIRGSVAGYDNVSAGVIVVAVRWPLSTESTPAQAPLNPAGSAMAEDQGRFQIAGLAPGEYRVLAVKTGDLSRMQPDTVSRAEKVTLERGGSQSVSLKIIEP